MNNDVDGDTNNKSTAPIIDIKNPNRDGDCVPILSYKDPDSKDTIALTMPPGIMIHPARATVYPAPFCRYCGNKYMADRVIPKFNVTRIVPNVKREDLNALKFNIGLSADNCLLT